MTRFSVKGHLARWREALDQYENVPYTSILGGDGALDGKELFVRIPECMIAVKE